MYEKKVTDEELNQLKKSVIVKAGDAHKRTMRLLTNLNVSSEDIDWTIKKFNFVCREFAENLNK